jgi:hypothetical protein
MFWTFKLSLDILAKVWATSPNIGRIFVQFSGHSDKDLTIVGGNDIEEMSPRRIGPNKLKCLLLCLSSLVLCNTLAYGAY